MHVCAARRRLGPPRGGRWRRSTETGPRASGLRLAASRRSRRAHDARAEGEDAHRECGTTSTRRAAERSSSPRRQPRCQQQPRGASRACHIVVTVSPKGVVPRSQVAADPGTGSRPRERRGHGMGNIEHGEAHVRGPRLHPRPRAGPPRCQATLRRCRRAGSSPADSTSGSVPGRWLITSPLVQSPS